MTKYRLWTALVALAAPLVLAACALANGPAQSAYGGPGNVVQTVSTQQTVGAGTLPFTGVNVAAILSVAVVLLATGTLLRRRTAAGRS
jgi:glutamate-1-semialdehyde aminotransferase